MINRRQSLTETHFINNRSVFCYLSLITFSGSILSVPFLKNLLKIQKGKLRTCRIIKNTLETNTWLFQKSSKNSFALSTKSSFKHLKGRDKITKWNEFEYRNTTCVVWKITKFESTKFFKKFTFFPIFSFFLSRNPRPFSPRDTFDTQRRLGREFRMEIKVVGKLGGWRREPLEKAGRNSRLFPTFRRKNDSMRRRFFPKFPARCLLPITRHLYPSLTIAG